MVDKNNSVTIKDVAQSAGVSIATVSRVLNHLPSVALETRKKVLSAMESLQYNRNEVARSLKVRQTKTIGVIAPELNNPFFMEVFEAMERAFAPMGYSMIIASSNGSVEEEKRKLQIFVQRNVDALVVMPAGAEEDHFVQKSVASIPLVMVDRHIEGLQVDTVLVDNRWAVKHVIRALVQEGYKRIGFIGGNPSAYTAKERLEGYYEAMRELNLSVEKEFVLASGPMNQANGQLAIQQALAKANHPQAFFIANHALHLGATTWAFESLNQDQLAKLVFATFDYLSYAPLLRLCHYAVAQPMEQIGNEVASLVLKRLAGDKSPKAEHILLKPQIKVMRANGAAPYEIK